MPLDIKKEFSAIRNQYKADPRQSTFNLLLLGKSGTGKTRILTTARKPVLVHSFDPGGTKTLKPWIDKGEIIPDTRFETEDFKTPTAFAAWEAEFNRLKKSGIFNEIGTYCIDSLTTFSDAILHAALKKEGRAGQPMQMKDWGVFLNVMIDVVNAITNVPCDVILTGHLSVTQDEASGKTEANALIAGQSKDRLPLLFDEVYVMQTKETSSGITYSLLTRNTGYYQAKTRIGAGKFEMLEPPDLKVLLKKAGLQCEDKPLFNEGENDGTAK